MEPINAQKLVVLVWQDKVLSHNAGSTEQLNRINRINNGKPIDGSYY